MADGDGTVLATSALADGYPSKVVKQRKIAKVQHMQAIGSDNIWNDLDEMIVGKK